MIELMQPLAVARVGAEEQHEPAFGKRWKRQRDADWIDYTDEVSQTAIPSGKLRVSGCPGRGWMPRPVRRGTWSRLMKAAPGRRTRN